MLRQTFHPLAPFVALSKTVPEIALRRCSPSTCLLPLLAVWTINKLLSTLCFLYDFFKRPGEIFIQELAADEQSRLFCSFRHFLLRIKSLSFPLNRLFLVFWKRTRKDSRASYLLQPAPVQTTGIEGDCQCIRSLLEKRLAHEWGLTLKTKSTVLARCPSCLGHLAGLQTGGKSLCAGRNPSHLLPPSGEPESWAVGKLCTPLSLHSRAPQEHQESGRGVDLCFLVASVCVELCGRKKVSAIFALEQAVFLQYCLPHLCKIISIEIKALWTPRGFHSIRHLKRKNQILQSIHENTLHQREDRGTTEQSQSCECFIFSVVDLTYKTGPKAFSGTARIGKA